MNKMPNDEIKKKSICILSQLLLNKIFKNLKSSCKQ